MLDKRYDPHKVEEGKYENWKSNGYFTAGRHAQAVCGW